MTVVQIPFLISGNNSEEFVDQEVKNCRYTNRLPAKDVIILILFKNIIN